MNESCTRRLDFSEPDELLARIAMPLMIFFACTALLTIFTLLFQFFVLFPKGAIHADYRIIFLSSNLVGCLDIFVCFCFLCYHLTGVAAANGPLDDFQGITKTTCTVGIVARFYLRAYEAWSLVFSGVERLIMAVRKKFEDPPNLTLGGSCVIGFSCVIPLISVSLTVVSSDRWGSSRCYCISQLDEGFSVRGEILQKVGLIFICSSGLLFHAMAYRINKATISDFHLDTMTHSLRQRFVVSSNIRLGRVLIHFVALHMICETCFSLVSMMPYLVGNTSHESLVLMKAIFYFIAILQSFLQIIIQNCYHETFYRRARKLIGIPVTRIDPRPEFVKPNSSSESPSHVNGMLLKLWNSEEQRLQERKSRETRFT